MATVDELKSALVKADAAGDTEAAQMFANDIKAHPDYRGDSSGWAKAGEGAAYGAAKVANFANKMNPIAHVMSAGKALINGTGWQGYQKGLDIVDTENYDKNIKPQLGWQGDVGEGAVDAVTSLIPVARGAKALEAVGAKVLPKVMQKIVPAAADVASNVAWSAGKAATEGKSLEEVGNEALWSGGGAAAARTASKVFRKAGKAATPDIDPEAQKLLDAGYKLTPGQAAPDSIYGRTEAGFKATPIVGEMIEKEQGNFTKAYIKNQADDALSSIGAKSEGTGLRMVDDARNKINQAYENVVPRTFGDTNEVINELNHIKERLGTVDFLGDPQAAQILKFIDNTIMPQIEKAGTSVPGRVMRDLDIVLGDAARGYRKSLSPTDWPMGEALQELQQATRMTLKGVDDAALADLQKAHDAYRKFLPIEHASLRAIEKPGGVPSVNRLNQSKQKFNQKRSDLDTAALSVQPGYAKSSRLGQGLRWGLGLPGSVAGAVLTGGKLPAAQLVGAAAYSPVGIRAQMAMLRGGQGLRHGITGSRLYGAADDLSLATQLGGAAGRQYAE